MIDAVPRKVEIIGVPLDLGAGLRGVDMGPSAMRHAGLAGRLRQLGLAVSDAGNLNPPIADAAPVGDSRSKYADAVGQTCAELKAAVQVAVERGATPLVLGGDHSLSIGSLAGIVAVRPEVRVLWLDAHGDLNTPATSPSGNVHGMPLAVALGLVPELFRQLGWSRHHLRPDQVALIGTRSLDAGERSVIRRLGLRVFTMADVDRLGIFAVVERALAELAPDDRALHISLDLDLVDPLHAPGVGTPVPGGLSYREAHAALELVAASRALGSIEAVEVNAVRDHENATGRLATDLILSAFGQTII